MAAEKHEQAALAAEARVKALCASMGTDAVGTDAVMSSVSVPEVYKCLITHALMVDPVIASDGNTYERRAIHHWLQQKQTSPMTNLHLRSCDLFPNRALKEAIEEFLKVGPALR